MASRSIASLVDDSTDDYSPTHERVRVEFGAETHPGRARDRNEDQFLVAKLAKTMRTVTTSLGDHGDTLRRSDEEGYLMVVADGMGGSAAGETASALAVETVESFALNSLKWFLHCEGEEGGELIGELQKALQYADQTIVERSHSDLSYGGMGTTLTLVFSVSTELFIVHAGDSRAYLFREGQLDQLTKDHTLVQVLVEAGALSRAAARHDRRRHIVTNALGGFHRGVHAEVQKTHVADGDILLLCTDGLSESLEDAEIAAILARKPEPETACRQLVEAAMEHGASDDVTAVIAHYAVHQQHR